MLARIDPVWIIEPADALQLATAFCNYARHSSLGVMDPRTRDLGAFLLALAMIEGPRLLRATQTRTARRAAAKATQAAHERGATTSPGGRVVNIDNLRPNGGIGGGNVFGGAPPI